MADSLGSVTVQSCTFAAGTWNGSYSSIKACYGGTVNSKNYVTVDKITLPTIAAKYGAPYTLSYKVSLLKGSTSTTTTSGTLYAYLCSSDPSGSSGVTCSSTAPSSYVAKGTLAYSGLTNGHTMLTVNINVSSGSLTSGGTYYIWLYTSSYTQIHYGGSSYVSGTLSATVKTYNQVYYPNGGSGSAVTYTKTHDTAYTLLSSMPSSWTKKANATSSYTVQRNGNGGTSLSNITSTKTTTYALGGWLEGSTSGTSRALGYSYTTNSAKNWYASWTGTGTWSSHTLGTTSRSNTTASGYTVSFNANGGNSTPSSLTATDTTKYTFSSWNTSSDGTGTSYNSTTSYTFKANYTLYAQWTSSTTKGSITLPSKITRSNDTTNYTTRFYTNYGDNSYTSASSAETIAYTFKGWGTSKNASSVSAAGTSYTPSKSLTLYANWTSTTTYSSVTFPTITRAGYKLLGWSTSASATTATYAAGATINPTSSVTYYAVWEATTQAYIWYDGAWRLALKYVWDTSSASGTTTSNLLDEGVLDEMIIS